MNERLRQLQRQRALLQEHLAWIEAEIAREPADRPEPAAFDQGGATPTTIESGAPPTADSGVLGGSQDQAATEADALLQRYASDERQNPDAIRRGCLLLFGGVLFTITLVIVGVWFAFYR